MKPESLDELSVFLEITRVPRPSGHLARIREYLLEFAESHGLEHKEDRAGNVLILRKGSSGNAVVLQCHQDMVPNSVKEFDFASTPLKAVIEDGWVHADGTTLGADDGSGMALMLCALADPELEGIPLECLFTTDEEIGLIGASKLEEGWLKGRTMVNLDNEDAGDITIGSAGSTDVAATFAVKRIRFSGKTYRMEASGLLGGHSAGMIASGRANAILLIAEFLSSLDDVRL
ncbi:MAG: M20/M25/M40 family metallo-hydrolase [Candidatus Methanomethylophilaceae archaeon]|nr:M20/M25/M40 family metallo-hydrolase [Candidatus Methanomethylophilaceae archaeon]